MVFLSWNILHGGGPERIPEIALFLVRHAPDVVVLSEFRAARGGQIRGVLADHGLIHQAASHGPDRANGVLIAAREPIRPTGVQGRPDGRFLDAYRPESDLHITGVHVPDDSDPGGKAFHWQRLVGLGHERLGQHAVIIGDLNTGRRGQDAASGCFACEALMGTLASLGWVDAWRHLNPGVREATWVAPWGEGRRIDAAWLSPSLAERLESATHLHEAREKRVSDHSALLVRLSPEGAADQNGEISRGIPRSAEETGKKTPEL